MNIVTKSSMAVLHFLQDWQRENDKKAAEQYKQQLVAQAQQLITCIPEELFELLRSYVLLEFYHSSVRSVRQISVLRYRVDMLKRKNGTVVPVAYYHIQIRRYSDKRFSKSDLEQLLKEINNAIRYKRAEDNRFFIEAFPFARPVLWRGYQMIEIAYKKDDPRVLHLLMRMNLKV